MTVHFALWSYHNNSNSNINSIELNVGGTEVCRDRSANKRGIKKITFYRLILTILIITNYYYHCYYCFY